MTPDKDCRILILGDFTFTNGEAAAHYVIGLGSALNAAGFAVEYLSPFPAEQGICAEFRRYPCHIALEGVSRKGCKHVWSRLIGAGNSIIRWLEERPFEEQYIIIAYPPRLCSTTFLLRLKRLCRKRRWKMIVVVVEWYGFRDRVKGRLHRQLFNLLDCELQLRVANRRIGHIMAVSSYLKRFYERLACAVVRVPPLIDVAAPKWRCASTKNGRSDGLRVLFSGSWKRERLDIAGEAILRLRSEGYDVALECLGFGPEELKGNDLLWRQMTEAPSGAFHFHGRVPVDEVLPITAAADFGILLRDKARWSNACFPSKVPEFQALGVPIMCNFTSDLDHVLKDGENALIVPGASVAEMTTTLRRALNLTSAEKEHLRHSSFCYAGTHFDYRNYVGTLSDFIRSF